MAGADYIIPLAGLVGEPVCNEDEVAAASTNLEAIRLLLSLRSAEQRIVFPCTNSGYGIGEQGTVSTEETPLRPISLYGRTKVEAEQAILDAGNSISLRLATVFGVSPRMRLDLLVNDFVHRAVTDRTVVISKDTSSATTFTFATWLARFFTLCAISMRCGGGPTTSA